jgi:hypothetical protein
VMMCAAAVHTVPASACIENKVADFAREGNHA